MLTVLWFYYISKMVDLVDTVDLYQDFDPEIDFIMEKRSFNSKFTSKKQNGKILGEHFVCVSGSNLNICFI